SMIDSLEGQGHIAFMIKLDTQWIIDFNLLDRSSRYIAVDSKLGPIRGMIYQNGPSGPYFGLQFLKSLQICDNDVKNCKKLQMHSPVRGFIDLSGNDSGKFIFSEIAAHGKTYFAWNTVYPESKNSEII